MLSYTLFRSIAARRARNCCRIWFACLAIIGAWHFVTLYVTPRIMWRDFFLVTLYLSRFILRDFSSLLFFYPQILCCHAPLLSVSCDFPHVTFLVMYLYSRYALVLTRLHLGHALYVTFSISDFSSLRWSPTHKILSLSRPIQRHGPLRITSLLCHALVITWRHYTLASLSFLSLTMFLFAVTLIKSHDVTVILPHSISLCHSPTNNVTSPFADTWPKLIFTYCQVVVRIIVLYFIALM